MWKMINNSESIELYDLHYFRGRVDWFLFGEVEKKGLATFLF